MDAVAEGRGIAGVADAAVLRARGRSRSAVPGIELRRVDDRHRHRRGGGCAGRRPARSRRHCGEAASATSPCAAPPVDASPVELVRLVVRRRARHRPSPVCCQTDRSRCSSAARDSAWRASTCSGASPSSWPSRGWPTAHDRRGRSHRPHVRRAARGCRRAARRWWSSAMRACTRGRRASSSTAGALARARGGCRDGLAPTRSATGTPRS